MHTGVYTCEDGQLEGGREVVHWAVSDSCLDLSSCSQGKVGRGRQNITVPGVVMSEKVSQPRDGEFDMARVSIAAAAKSLQSCPNLCDPTDGSPPGSPVPGILQARTLEWVAISFSNA